MKKIVTILGARPQFVKAAVLSRIIKKYGLINEIIIHTGQHYDANMSQVFFDEMDIPSPKYNLNINGLQHGAMTGQMLDEIEKILLSEKPNAVLVYGDTNTTLAGALAAKKLHIKVIHIEAGLRSFNMQMPEEINRILTDRISDLLACPTDVAMQNLQKEGFDAFPSTVVKTGDIMKDAVVYYSAMVTEKSTIISDLSLDENQFILATIHRQENTDKLENLKSIFEGFSELTKQIKVVFPVHPRTKKLIQNFDIPDNLLLIEPVGYFDMLSLLKHCKLVITDSGGLQKEAYFNQKFCIIVREETEWVELVHHNFAKIVGCNAAKMLEVYYYFSNQLFQSDNDLYGTQVGEAIHTEILKIL
ncbi:MAG: UDP-N-acetylglucosamine 2-epimerase (non-hydrolyzing) [Bacteroidetes bacterium]|nr:UDP-N-acetylglucosamine 2-epimerase (non-hydrolyzing) [Bacteroidota bacterium]